MQTALDKSMLVMASKLIARLTDWPVTVANYPMELVLFSYSAWPKLFYEFKSNRWSKSVEKDFKMVGKRLVSPPLQVWWELLKGRLLLASLFVCRISICLMREFYGFLQLPACEIVHWNSYGSNIYFKTNYKYIWN